MLNHNAWALWCETIGALSDKNNFVLIISVILSTAKFSFLLFITVRKRGTILYACLCCES